MNMLPTNTSPEQLLDLLDKAQVTSSKFQKASKEVQQLFGMIAAYADFFPESKKVFIGKALEWADSPNLQNRYKAFLLFSTWVHEKNPTINEALRSIELPKEDDDKVMKKKDKKWWQFWVSR
jgi:hypothetical protein